RLGVTHGGEGLGIVRRAPVALAVDQGVAVAERLGHQHHGLVAGRVAVGVELAEHVADGPRGFLVFRIGVQAEFAHGVDDAPLHGLETVTDVRQRAVHDHVHGIVEVSLLGEIGEGAPLHAVQAQVENFAHGRSVACWRSTRVPARWVNSSCFRALMPSSIWSPPKPGATMARTSCRTISPMARLSRRVRKPVVWPLAVSRFTGAPRDSPSSSASSAGMATSVAPVSSRKVTGLPLIRPSATKCPWTLPSSSTSI